MASEDFTALSFSEYWSRYLRDLIEPLSEKHSRVVLENLFDGFLDGIYAGRETAQRLIEVHTGVITHKQYVSWSMANEHDDGTEHVLAHLVDGEFVGGSRSAMLDLLGNVDYTNAFRHRMVWAQRRGLLSEWEVTKVLGTSLRTAPLPRFVDRPAGVPALRFRRIFHLEQQFAHAG